MTVTQAIEEVGRMVENPDNDAVIKAIRSLEKVLHEERGELRSSLDAIRSDQREFAGRLLVVEERQRQNAVDHRALHHRITEESSATRDGVKEAKAAAEANRKSMWAAIVAALAAVVSALFSFIGKQ